VNSQERNNNAVTQLSDANSEFSRLQRTPGYTRLKRRLFYNLMNAVPDHSPRNIRIDHKKSEFGSTTSANTNANNTGKKNQSPYHSKLAASAATGAAAGGSGLPAAPPPPNSAWDPTKPNGHGGSSNGGNGGGGVGGKGGARQLKLPTTGAQLGAEMMSITDFIAADGSSSSSSAGFEEEELDSGTIKRISTLIQSEFGAQAEKESSKKSGGNMKKKKI
jgi:hypothetical protein